MSTIAIATGTLVRKLDERGIPLIAFTAFVIVAVAGGVLAIVRPEIEPFDRYITHMTVAAAAFGIGWGVKKRNGAKDEGDQ